MNEQHPIPLKLGFIKLTDSAPFIIAKERGIFDKYGLSVELIAQNSWATLRDKLEAGLLDAAHMLAPMPFASQAGVSGARTDIIAPLVTSQNGNGITLASWLCEQIKSYAGLDTLPNPMPSWLLKKAIEERKQQGLPKLKFASVFPYSCHYLQLIDYLAFSNIDLSEIECVFMPPTNMSMSLQSGDIDGFCVGGPYNAKSVRNNTGVTVLTSYDIWQDKVEKVLAITEQAYLSSPDTYHKLCAALIDACQWLKDVPNRFEAARIISSDKYLDTAIDIVAPSLLGSCLTEYDASPRQIPHYNRFCSLFSAANEGKFAVNRPTHDQAMWIYNKLNSVWSDAFTLEKADKLISSCFREDIFELALKARIEPE